jgi:hypothetical protein
VLQDRRLQAAYTVARGVANLYLSARRAPFGRGFRLCWCPASEVRETLQQPLTRTSEATGHEQGYDLSAALDLKFLTGIAASGAGTSKRRH